MPLDTLATIESGFTLKQVFEMIRTYIQMYRTQGTHNTAQSLGQLAKWLSIRL